MCQDELMRVSCGRGMVEDTSEEDQDCEVRPKLGEGVGGRGRPLRADACGKLRDFHDGAGLCTPGRWPPDRGTEVVATVGGEEIEQKLRIEKVLSRHLQDFRIELEKKSYQKELPKPLMKEITESKLQAAARLGEQPEQKQAAGAEGSKSPAKSPGNSPAKLNA